MNCIESKFKSEYGISDETNTILLNHQTETLQMSMISYVNSVNEAALKDDFEEELFHVSVNENRTMRIEILRDNIQKYEAYRDKLDEIEYQESRILEASMEIETSFTEDQINSDNLLDEQENHSPLFAPTVNQGPITTTDPKTFYEWKESRINLLNILHKLARKYGQLKEKNKQKEIYSVIEEIEAQLQKIDITNPETIYESSIDEINSLEYFLQTIYDDPIDAANALDSNQLLKRIDDLGMYFLGQNPVTGKAYKYTEFGDDKKAISTFYFNFSQNLDPEKSKELERRVTELKRKYDRTQVKIIQGILLNDSLIDYNISKDNGWTTEDRDDLLKALENVDVDIDVYSKRFLGAAAGGGLLGQLLKNVKDSQLTKERGHTQERLNQLLDSWKDIKDEFSLDDQKTKAFVTLKLFSKDAFGIKQNKLISRYSDLFFSKIRNVSIERSLFYKGMNAGSYKNWMDADKENFHRINPMLLSSIANVYRTHPEFGKHFTSTDQEISDYETELKRVLGKTMFDIETEKAKELIDQYDDAVKNGTLTYQQEHRRNPFIFIERYNSQDYDKKNDRDWYLEPDFTRFVPRDEKAFYNEDFESTENGEHGESLMKFYKNAYSLMTEYSNPTLKSEGLDINTLDVVSYEDSLERETMKSLVFFGKISKHLKALWDNHIKKYYDASIMQQKRDMDNPDFEKKLQVGYNGYAKKEFRILFDLYKIKDIKELVELAKEKGYELKDIPTEKDPQLLKKYIEDLSKSLAQNDINKSTSTNLYESIKNSVFLANDINARRASVGVLEAMKSYTEKHINEVEVGKDRKLYNIGEYLNSWGNSNIYGYKYSRDFFGMAANNPDSKIAKIEFGGKYLSTIEKEVKKILEEEVKNRSNKDNYQFNFDKVSYFTKEGKHYKKVSEGKAVPISLKEISEVYGEYLNDKLNNLGVQKTVGSFALGIMSNIILKQLGVNPRGGIRNRVQGYTQSLAVAASNRYGFGEKEYQYARNLLRGTNVRKYILANQFNSTERGRKIETVKLFQQAMQIQQNRADELAVEGSYNSASGDYLRKVKDFWMDFSINNPEWHNQTELMLSVMQGIMVDTVNIDSDGKVIKKPFYDGKIQEFIYTPGTMDLKPEFDTKDNRDMWIEFKETDSGRKDSINAITKVKTAVQQTQGNYDNTDIIMAQSSVGGKLLTMYQRYFFENANLQWGTSKVDIRTGEFDIKGRKINLFSHAPTAAVYLAGVHGVQIAAGIAAGMTALPLGIAVTGSLGFSIAFAYYKRKQFTEASNAKNEFLLALDFGKEVAIRSLRTPLSMFSYGKIDVGSEMINDLQKKGLKRNLTEKQRLLLSESAQDIATKVLNYTAYTISALLVKALWIMCTGGPDDDDEKSKLQKLIDIDGILNAIINDRNTTMNEIDKYTNPTAFFDEAGSMSYFKTLGRTKDYILKDIPAVLSGKKDFDREFLYKTTANIPFITTPNQVMKAILSEDKGIFDDNRVYEGKTSIDKKYIYKGVKNEKDTSKEEVKEKRKDLKKKAQSYYEEQVDKEFSDRPDENKEKIIESRVKKFMKSTNKKDSQSYQNLNDSDVWKNKEDQLK